MHTPISHRFGIGVLVTVKLYLVVDWISDRCYSRPPNSIFGFSFIAPNPTADEFAFHRTCHVRTITTIILLNPLRSSKTSPYSIGRGLLFFNCSSWPCIPRPCIVHGTPYFHVLIFTQSDANFGHLIIPAHFNALPGTNLSIPLHVTFFCALSHWIYAGGHYVIGLDWLPPSST